MRRAARFSFLLAAALVSLSGGPAGAAGWTSDDNYVATTSRSGRVYLQVECDRPGSIWLRVGDLTAGWNGDGPAAVQIDDRSFTMVIDAFDTGVILSNIQEMGIDAKFRAALKAGAKLTLMGKAAAKMKAADKEFSLAGATAAISKVEKHCGL